MKYLVEIEVEEKQEMPPDAQDIDLQAFLDDHLYDISKHHDATKYVVRVRTLYKVKDALAWTYIKAILG